MDIKVIAGFAVGALLGAAVMYFFKDVLFPKAAVQRLGAAPISVGNYRPARYDPYTQGFNNYMPTQAELQAARQPDGSSGSVPTYTPAPRMQDFSVAGF